MSTGFDPYRKWLGIPPQDQPANHYRLLGLTVFEEDPEVIEDAAVRQIAYVRTFQTGKYAAYSQKVLNELSAARIVLLQRDKKRAYDAELRQQMAMQRPPEPEYAQQPEYPPPPAYPPQPTFPFPQERLEPRFYAPPSQSPPMPPPPPTSPVASGSKRVPVGRVVPVGKPVVRAVTPPPAPPYQPVQQVAPTPPPPPKKKNVPIPVPKAAPMQEFAGEAPPVGQFPAVGGFPAVADNSQFPSPAYQTPASPARRGAPVAGRRGVPKGSGKQNPVALVLGGMAVVCVVALGAVVYVFTREPEKPKVAKRPTAPAVVEEPATEPVAEPVTPPPAMPMSPGITPVAPMPTNIVPIPATPETPMPMPESPVVTPMPEKPPPVKPAPPPVKENPQAVLTGLRKSLQERDNEAFKTQFEKAEAMAAEIEGPNAERFKQQLEHLRDVGKFLAIFWDAVSETASKGMVPGERYRFRGKEFVYTSFDGGEMEYRYDGKRESFAPKEFPPDIALIIAYRAFGNDDVEGKTAIGMFASFDPAAIKEPANQSMVARILQDFQNFGDDINKALETEHNRVPDNPMSGEADVSPPQRLKIK